MGDARISQARFEAGTAEGEEDDDFFGSLASPQDGKAGKQPPTGTEPVPYVSTGLLLMPKWSEFCCITGLCGSLPLLL